MDGLNFALIKIVDHILCKFSIPSLLDNHISFEVKLFSTERFNFFSPMVLLIADCGAADW